MAIRRGHPVALRAVKEVQTSFGRVQYEVNLYNVKLNTEIEAKANLALANRLAARGKITRTFMDITGALRASFRAAQARGRFRPAANWIAWSTDARQGFPLNQGHEPPGPRRNLSTRAFANLRRRLKSNREELQRQDRRYKRGHEGGFTPARPFVEEAINAVAPVADGLYGRVIDRETAVQMPRIRAKSRSKYPPPGLAGGPRDLPDTFPG